MPKTIRIVIADDHPVFRTGLRLVIGTEEDEEYLFTSQRWCMEKM